MVLPDNNLTDEQKQAECKRICGAAGERGMHVSAPELCPILWDTWRKPPKRPEY